MGVYIKGMEMPPKGKGAVVILCSSGAVYSGGQKVGTAVPVPPHGDLIERKTAYDSLLHGMVMTGYQSRALSCIDEFRVPTIVPAEPAEEGE